MQQTMGQHATDNMQRAADNITVNRTIATRVRLGSLLRPRVASAHSGSSFVVSSIRAAAVVKAEPNAAVRRSRSGVPDRVVCMGHLPSGMRLCCRVWLPAIGAPPAGDASWRTSCHSPR